MRRATAYAKAVLVIGLLAVAGWAWGADNSKQVKHNNKASIQFDGKRKAFLLQTDHSSYAFGLGANALFINLYWGGKVNDIGDIPEPWETHYFHQPHGFTHGLYSRFEYPANTGSYFLEPCLKLEKP
ncbi:MAG: hypothetical protein WA117_03710, partial [Verrucomicrobiia bacterium]